MLVIKAEVWPSGAASHAHEIARVGIANVSELAPVSDYQAVMRSPRGGTAYAPVLGHRRAEGWTALAARTLEALRTPVPAPPDAEEIVSLLDGTVLF